MSQGVDLINIPLTCELDSVATTSDMKYDLIGYHQFDSLMERYNKQNEQEIIVKFLRMGSRITVVPNSKIIDWFHLRSKYISYKIFYESNKPMNLLISIMNHTSR